MAEPRTDYSDTSRWSFHVDDAFYAELAGYVDLLDADWPEEDAATLSAAQSFLVREARLIDEGRFNDWLDLFTDDCLYWVPVVPGGATRPGRCPTRSTTAAG